MGIIFHRLHKPEDDLDIRIIHSSHCTEEGAPTVSRVTAEPRAGPGLSRGPALTESSLKLELLRTSVTVKNFLSRSG